MRSSEAIIGEYYHVLYPQQGTFLVIRMDGIGKTNRGKIDEDRIIGPHLANMNNPKFNYTESSLIYFGDDRKTRIATWEERQWLDACIDANQFIPKDKIKFQSTYEIY
jgi:hypothetical protein